MTDLVNIATKRLETLKAELARVEQFLAFAAELQSGDPDEMVLPAPKNVTEIKGSEPANDGTGASGGFQLKRDNSVPAGGTLRDSAKRMLGT